MAANPAPIGSVFPPSILTPAGQVGEQWPHRTLLDRLHRRHPDPLRRYRRRLDAIAALEPELAAAADVALRDRATALRQRVLADEPLDQLLVEAFALVRETAHRTLGMRPFEVQLACGIALHEGCIAEMATGEGKTLAAVAPVFLNALTGHGVHVLTFNDYLARRDAAWMGPAYHALGLSVGFVQEGQSPTDRKRAYTCDVTYATAKEAGFDLLRDNLCLEPEHQVHRPFHLALVDEADSILIDDARIPMVIAGATECDTLPLAHLAMLVRRLVPAVDFATDEYAHNIFLTERGTAQVEALLGCGNLFESRNLGLLAAIRNALHAERFLRRDIDYIVRDGAIELVDELTGRVADKRQWPDGLQAAVEAKEGLRQGRDGAVLGSITLQHFLRLYPRLAGMTATAESATDELREVYGLETVVIPPNRPCLRADEQDRIYTHGAARDHAVVGEIAAVHANGRPILVGTASVIESERLAAFLRHARIPCRILNAKNDEQEAAIVADAGAVGAVTISTNMAGRGTDIKLGGHDERARAAVLALGGLYVIGTTRHESVRIDRQLRGRAGRQGDPGSSRFFVSLEDDLLRRYGVIELIPERERPTRTDWPVESKAVRIEVLRAQRIVEGESFDIRKRLYSYAGVLEAQRLSIQRWRQEVLAGDAPLGLLVERCDERWHALEPVVGEAQLVAIERRVTLWAVDRCWAQYLADMTAVRDEIQLVALEGRTPLAEFIRTAIASFDHLLERIDDTIASQFEALTITQHGVDWERAGLVAPSATWTYLVNDTAFRTNLMRSLANHASVGGPAAALLWPLLFLFGLYQRWQQHRRLPPPAS